MISQLIKFTYTSMSTDDKQLSVQLYQTTRSHIRDDNPSFNYDLK